MVYGARRSSRTRARSLFPPGYKVGRVRPGLDTVTSITVDRATTSGSPFSGNTFGFPPEGIDKPHVKDLRTSRQLIKDNVGLGMFKSLP